MAKLPSNHDIFDMQCLRLWVGFLAFMAAIGVPCDFVQYAQVGPYLARLPELLCCRTAESTLESSLLTCAQETFSQLDRLTSCEWMRICLQH